MAKAEATVEELVGMIERGELCLPEMQRQYVWRSTRVRDLLDSLYRRYPSRAILLWETDEAVPRREFAVPQQHSPYQSTRLLLDGQQRLTSLAAGIRGEPVTVRGRQRPIDLLFNLEHPDEPAVTEVNENDDDDDPSEDEVDSTEDELQRHFDKMTCVVSTRKLAQLPHWSKVSEVFKTDSDAALLKRAGVSGFVDPRYEQYSQRLARLRSIRKYVYRMDVLERLHNQLVGQYLRDARSKFGVFLLVWRGTKTEWRESESGKRCSFGNLLEQLEAQSEDILQNRYDLQGIRVVGIDLTKRDTRHIH